MRIRKFQRGMSLIELMVAITILAVGLLAVMSLVMTATATNNRNERDTGGTMTAQVVIEAIANTTANSTVIRDCAGTAFTVATTAPAAVGTSSGANLNSNNTGIDFSQAVGAVPANYHANFVSCGTGGQRSTYDVRWNIRRISTNSVLVTVSGQPRGSDALRGLYFATPVNLRTVVTKY